VKDAAAQLRTATRRAKSDVANKMVSMFLHELSRRVSQNWGMRVESEEYEKLVRERFQNQCPYCSCDLIGTIAVIEHLDGLNRYRAGLHVPGNVLVACKNCNIEKRRDDSLRALILAPSGWESFLSHDGTGCQQPCLTCAYWQRVWEEEAERKANLSQNVQRIRCFRGEFPELDRVLSGFSERLPALLTKLYADCQSFAEAEIASLLQRVDLGQQRSQ
jgi:hypothetical protein